jgi:septum site-determining protein MinD
MGKIIAVTSGKGGTGKTTAVAAISSCLAALNYRTLCVDMDTGLSNLDLALGMSGFAIADFTDLLSGTSDIDDSCRECPDIKNLFFLGAPVNFIQDKLDETQVVEMFDTLREKFDYCLLDLPAGIGEYFMSIVSHVDVALIVTICELPAIRCAQKTAEKARELGVPDLRILVNRVRSKRLKKINTTIDDVINLSAVQLVGVAAEDNAVYIALHNGTPLVLQKGHHVGYDFLDAARRLTGEEVPTSTKRRKKK